MLITGITILNAFLGRPIDIFNSDVGRHVHRKTLEIVRDRHNKRP